MKGSGAAVLYRVALQGGLLLAMACGSVAAAGGDLLQERVQALIAKRLPARSQIQQIDIGQPATRISACAEPLPVLARPEQNAFGRVAVEVRCQGEDGVAGYLQVNVSVVGDYVVSSQRIAADDLVRANMLQIRRGPLERLPKGAVLKAEQVIGLQASRSLRPGVPLVASQFRERWLVERNQRVVLRAQGEGFRINLDGKALDNGNLGNTVRVLSSDGKTLNAQVIGRNELVLRF